MVVGSFSKTYAMTGWRIGYLLGPAPVVRAVENIQSHATSNPTSFAMVGALAALRHAEPEVEVMIAEYRARREIIAAGAQRHPRLPLPAAARRLLRLPRGLRPASAPARASSVAMAEYLLEEAAVAVVPGAAFGADDHIRLSFACSRATLTEGLERIAAALARLTLSCGEIHEEHRSVAFLACAGLLLTLAGPPVAGRRPREGRREDHRRKPTVEEARKFLDDASKRLLDLSIEAGRAAVGAGELHHLGHPDPRRRRATRLLTAWPSISPSRRPASTASSCRPTCAASWS